MASVISVPGYDTIDEVRMFYDQCVAFWQRQGDSPDVARCKAFWWDIVEISECFARWTPGKEFRNLRDDATFKLVATRAAQAESEKEIHNQQTIQGME